MKFFTSWNNGEHLHSAIRFVTPDARNDRATLDNRASRYANAHSQIKERWSRKTRNWQSAGPVWPNHESEIITPEIGDSA